MSLSWTSDLQAIHLLELLAVRDLVGLTLLRFLDHEFGQGLVLSLEDVVLQYDVSNGRKIRAAIRLKLGNTPCLEDRTSDAANAPTW